MCHALCAKNVIGCYWSCFKCRTSDVTSFAAQPKYNNVAAAAKRYCKYSSLELRRSFLPEPDFDTSVTFFSAGLYWEMREPNPGTGNYSLGNFKWTPRNSHCDFLGVSGL